MKLPVTNRNWSKFCLIFFPLFFTAATVIDLNQWLPGSVATRLYSSKIDEVTSGRNSEINERTRDRDDKVKEEILIRNKTTILDNNTGEFSELPKCPNISPLLTGYSNMDLVRAPATLEKTEANNKLVTIGGEYKPANCRAISKVAIIIPLRNRERHLRYFMQYMHPLLQRQQLHYKIYLINQFGNQTFNRAKLMNVGYSEALRNGFQCYVFHDVDLILTNDHCPYACQTRPVHLAHYVDKFDGLPYHEYVGGVLQMSREQFERVNGFSNMYWGWGGEDDDMYYRMKAVEMHFMRHPMKISRYKMVRHKADVGNEKNPQRFELLNMTKKKFSQDGLNTLDYKVISYEESALYTNVTVDIFAIDESEKVKKYLLQEQNIVGGIRGENN